MKKSKLLVWPVSGLTLMGVGVSVATMATPAGAESLVAASRSTPGGLSGHDSDAPCAQGDCRGQEGAVAPGDTKGNPVPLARFSPDKWDIIGRNTLGGPNAVLRHGPYGRPSPSFAAAQPPPYGVGSLGIIVGSGSDKIAFGNETIFAGRRLASFNTLKYWVFAGVDSLAGVILPNITIEVDPNVGPSNYASLVYLPNSSVSPSAPATPLPNVWQQYDAGAAGSQWYATGATGPAINCTQATPCSFAQLKSRLPDAVVSYSLGISKGRDTPFVGAVDGLQVNQRVYDFEPSGVRRSSPIS